MRVLKAITIGMGVLIVVGTTVLIAVIFHRATSPVAAPVATQVATMPGATQGATMPGATQGATMPSAPIALVLDQPAGTHIAGIAATQDRLAVELQGGGGDRVVLVDPRSGAVTGRITLAH